VPNKEFIIQKGFSFNSIEEKMKTSDNQRAITYYANKLPSAVNLPISIPIFLDTNVLLRGYSITPDRRADLYDFFFNRKNQIIITKQIEQEFIRNRKKVIDDYKNLPDVHLSDTSDVLSNLLFELKSEEESEISEDANFETDELLNLYSTFEKINNLSNAEKDFLKLEFDFLTKEFNSIKNKNAVEVSNMFFPGMGDILEKPKFPYGDYFIYHEMLKYASEKNQDIIFLTFDVAKNDWLKSNKHPHEHYIHRTFTLNGKMIFILDANNFFEKIYATSFDALVPLPKKVDQFILASKFEKELASAFQALEQRIRKLAKKLNLDVTDDDSTKYILDDLNYDEHIDDDTFYELIGIWPIRDELLDGDIETIRRTYTSNELTETFAVVEDHIRLMDKLI
jgi:hypothetical protein